MWLMSGHARRRLMFLAKQKGMTVDDWWWDETKLFEYWAKAYYPETGLRAVPAALSGKGDAYVWIRRIVTVDAKGWHAEAIGPGPLPQTTAAPGLWGTDKAIAWPAGYVTLFASDKAPRTRPEPIRPGDRIMCAVGGTSKTIQKRANMAICRTVDEHGNPDQVQIGEEHEIVPAAALAPYWFKCSAESEDAFDALWQAGETLFGSYISMLNKLRHTKHRIDKEKARTQAKLTKKEKAAAAVAK